MSRNVRKRTLLHVHPTKIQISLRMRAVWSESSLSAWRYFASLAIQKAPSEDSDQTAQMRSLIWNFAGRTCPKVCFLTLRSNFANWDPYEHLIKYTSVSKKRLSDSVKTLC